MVEQITEPDQHIGLDGDVNGESQNSALTSWAASASDTGPMPVKTWTGFMCFTIYNRPQLRKDHPDVAPRDMLKLAGQKWNICSANEKERWTQEAIRQNQRRQAFGSAGFKISTRKGVFASNKAFNENIGQCVNIDGPTPPVFSSFLSREANSSSSTPASQQMSREERIKKDIDATESRDDFIKFLPKSENPEEEAQKNGKDIQIDQIMQACTGENSFLNQSKEISSKALTSGLIDIGELPPEPLAISEADQTSTKIQSSQSKFDSSKSEQSIKQQIAGCHDQPMDDASDAIEIEVVEVNEPKSRPASTRNSQSALNSQTAPDFVNID